MRQEHSWLPCLSRTARRYSTWLCSFPSSFTQDVSSSTVLLSCGLGLMFSQVSSFLFLPHPPGILALEKAAWQEAVGDGILPLNGSVCGGCHPLPSTAPSRQPRPWSRGAPAGNWCPCPPEQAGSELRLEAAGKKPEVPERLGLAWELRPGVC